MVQHCNIKSSHTENRTLTPFLAAQVDDKAEAKAEWDVQLLRNKY